MTRRPFYVIMLGGLVLFLGLVLVSHYVKPEKEAAEPGKEGAAQFDAAAAFASNCASCHGQNLEGGFGPSLVGLNLKPEEIAEIMTKGKGKMPPGVFQGSDEEKLALAKWILEHKK